MTFNPPSWAPQLPDIPDSISVADFINTDKAGRKAFSGSKSPYTCGVTGQSRSAAEVAERVDLLARGLAKNVGFDPHDGTAWDRVVAVYALNTIDYIPVTHAIHRVDGIVTPASSAHSASELEHQLRSSGAKALFTCAPLLSTTLKAAHAVGIPDKNIFLLPLPDAPSTESHKSIEDLISEGQNLPPLSLPAWVPGQGKRQTAYLCYSSGTSGLPKAVMISHYNVIACTLMIHTYESVTRQQDGIDTQVALGLLPFSHIYGLVVIAHIAQYRGDEIIVLQRFQLDQLLASIQKFRIEQLSVVPPIIVQLLSSQDKCRKYDLGSVRLVFSGAAPLGSETIQKLLELYPKWRISQGYGLTEASPSVFHTSEADALLGSSGSLLPGAKAKIIDQYGNEVTEHETPGELYVQAPNVVLGYLHNEKANAETFVWREDGRWLRTGDEVLVRKSARGFEHFFVVDRIKELIKVKGHQVAPAELEAHLLDHPYVADSAVIGIVDERAGEVPLAFIVKSREANGISDQDIVKAVHEHVEQHKARHKWLKGGVRVLDVIPKSPSGKILRRILKAKVVAEKPVAKLSKNSQDGSQSALADTTSRDQFDNDPSGSFLAQAYLDLRSGNLSTSSTWTTAALAAVIALSLLNYVLTPRLDPREPPTIKPTIPWIGHILGIIRHQADYSRILHNANPNHPIATLPMLNGKLYAVFDPSLLQSLFRNKTASFEPFAVDYAKKTFGLTQEEFRKVKAPGVYDDFTEAIHASFQTASLQQMNIHFLRSISAKLDPMSNGTMSAHTDTHGKEKVVNGQLQVDNLYLWCRDVMSLATTKALYGDTDPFESKPGLIEDMWCFEESVPYFLLSLFPAITMPKAYKARSTLQNVVRKWYAADHDITDPSVSTLVRNRAGTLRRYGFTGSEIGKFEVILPNVATLNAVPTFYWLLLYILDRPDLLVRVRTEAEALAVVANENGKRTVTLNIAEFEAKLPLLVSCYRETMRLVNQSLSMRRVLEDITVTTPEGTSYILKKGTDIQLPAGVAHYEQSVWGLDTNTFNPERFHPSYKGSPDEERKRKAAYIPFGGGRHLCPGRNFAFAEIIGFASSLLLGFDLEAVGMAFGDMKKLGPQLAGGTVRPEKYGAGLGARIKTREGWENVEWKFEC
ncbi:putative phenylacetyl- ligase [Fusarium longipes]|uniref:Putative phenylacetyl-ligase n=1 Tax=Fusarium longipes TaxID=694270 RepID=A0A395T7M3_9HYPO|nr:putative phenylacetyl- ligase [Fusarium longipes]